MRLKQVGVAVGAELFSMLEMVLFCATVGFCIASVAGILQHLCLPTNEYGQSPLHTLHDRLANALHDAKWFVLLRLAYCFKCQAIWYSVIVNIYIWYTYSKHHWCSYILITCITWAFAQITVKNISFKPPKNSLW